MGPPGPAVGYVSGIREHLLGWTYELHVGLA